MVTTALVQKTAGTPAVRRAGDLPVINPYDKVRIVYQPRVFRKLMVSDDVLHESLCKVNDYDQFG